MSLLRSDRVWLFGGIILVALLVASGWFLLISPKYTQASDRRGQVEDTTTQLSKLRKGLADLKADNENLTTYKAKKAAYLKALPSGDDIPAFLTQLQTMGTKLKVNVAAYSASGRTKSDAVTTVEELPITLSATGKVADISKFVSQLQNTQPRAVLIDTVSVEFKDGNAALSLTLTAFRNTADTTTAVTTG
ncbi:type 4a pilus biogenesis protein PilO [Actinoplanes regularis]|uniref:Tfp pilus assembly protein PilO n=1 Tax=Actinoplanes regularis TaxID=52697 RepID=A0A239BKP7_9ACTN|nr:type 4a pilus biogenesis protein PilO [Actinoplanes regularis]GIE88087.1 hypothetical protein Are01nite_45670 [Actinoplanes regularis]SNS08446.1 Tfp pilus assembly protein PilO [Actinoplanes regularis]